MVAPNSGIIYLYSEQFSQQKGIVGRPPMLAMIMRCLSYIVHAVICCLRRTFLSHCPFTLFRTVDFNTTQWRPNFGCIYTHIPIYIYTQQIYPSEVLAIYIYEQFTYICSILDHLTDKRCVTV